MASKILFIDPANFVGGAELFLLDFIKFLAKENVTISLFTTGLKSYVDKIPKGVKIRVVGMPRLSRNLKGIFGLFSGPKQLRSSISVERPALVVSNSVRSHVLSALALKNEALPLIWILHDYTFPKLLMKLLVKVPRTIICVSSGVEKYVLKTVGSKYKNKVVVIPNAVDLLEISRLQNEPLVLAQKKSDGEFWIGNIGRIEPWKGQLYFLEAAKKIVQIMPKARFFIIGSPIAHKTESKDYYIQLKKWVADKRLSKKIIFTGQLANVYPLMKQLDIVVHNAVEAEPFGRVVIEAMAMEKAVIAANTGGPSEVIIDKKTGVLIDPTNTERLIKTVVTLCRDSKRRRSLGHAAKKEVEKKFSSEIVYKKLYEVLLKEA